MNKKTKTIFWIAMAVIIVVVVAILFQQIISPRYTEVHFSTFTEKVEEAAKTEDAQIEIYVDGYNYKGIFKMFGP